MGSFGAFHLLVLLGFVALVIWVVRLLMRSSTARPDEVANTWKFRTVVFVVLAFVVPLWIVTFPLFLFLAYRSYVAGKPSAGAAQANTATRSEEIGALHALLQKGALSQDEFEAEKRKLLGSS